MNVVERTGTFLPSKLLGELRAAGLDVAGVTCTEDEGAVVAVQIISEEPLDETLVDTVCGAHEPAEPAVVEQPVDPLVAALEKMPPDQVVTTSDLLAILRPDTMNTDAPAHPDHPAAGA